MSRADRKEQTNRFGVTAPVPLSGGGTRELGEGLVDREQRAAFVEAERVLEQHRHAIDVAGRTIAENRDEIDAAVRLLEQHRFL